LHIRTLQIKGFRSLRDVTWSPGRLNLVIGPNGSGKSNLLRGLALLRHAALGDLAAELERQGGIAQLFWDGRAETLVWKLETESLGALEVGASGEVELALLYQLDLKRSGQTSNFRIERERLDRLEALSSVPLPALLDAVPGRAIVRMPPREAFYCVPPEELSDTRPLLGSMQGPVVHPTTTRFRADVSRMALYQGIEIRPGAAMTQAAVARTEHDLAPDGQNLVTVLHTLYAGDRDLKKTIDAAMLAAFGSEYEELVFAPAEDQRVQLRVRWRSLRTAQNAADLSDGTLRFLLLLAILLQPRPGPILAIDAPETGLHPRMLPVVAELAAEASRRTSVVLTTHSPELLAAFQTTRPTVTVAGCIDGETRLSVVDGEDDLARWLDTYSPARPVHRGK
jgi:predicted ATPase